MATPGMAFPEMTLRALVVVPPTVTPTAWLSSTAPTPPFRPLGIAAVPFLSVPIKFPAMVVPVALKPET
jgi:hypothetical protein